MCNPDRHVQTICKNESHASQGRGQEISRTQENTRENKHLVIVPKIKKKGNHLTSYTAFLVLVDLHFPHPQ